MPKEVSDNFMVSEGEEMLMLAKLRKRGILISTTEDRFARELRRKRVPYRRQVKIGAYRVDFLVSSFLIVDINGPHHERCSQSLKDMKRKVFLESRGFRVYEFSASELFKSPGKYAELVAQEHSKLAVRNRRLKSEQGLEV